MNDKTQSPLVAVWMITYNQEQYIAQAISSVINQKTNYKYRLYIGEDCSTDNTRKICEEYATKFPELIELICTKTNNLKQNAENIYGATFNSGAKYIAMLEGDDYWIDEYKLQKQIDFLENNDECVLCFTRGVVLNEFSNSRSNNSDLDTGYYIDIPTLINGNLQLTASVVFKLNSGFKLPSWFSEIAFGDWLLYLVLMHTYKKKAYCLPDISAVYRIHASGIHGNLHQSNNKLITAYKLHLRFYDFINKKLFEGQYKKEIRNAVSNKVTIISNLYYDDKRFLAGFSFNLKNLFQGLNAKVFILNMLRLQKGLIKSIVP